MLALVLAGPQVGLAQAALDYVIEKAPRLSIAYTSFERQSDSTAFQTTLADAAMLVDTARLHVARAAADIEAAKAQAIADLRGEVATLAIGAAEVVVERNLDRDTQAQLVEQYIASVQSRN